MYRGIVTIWVVGRCIGLIDRFQPHLTLHYHAVSSSDLSLISLSIYVLLSANVLAAYYLTFWAECQPTASCLWRLIIIMIPNVEESDMRA